MGAPGAFAWEAVLNVTAVRFLQVGAVLGRARLDSVFRYVASEAWTGVFVEPNPILSAELVQAYTPFKERVTVLDGAVAPATRAVELNCVRSAAVQHGLCRGCADARSGAAVPDVFPDLCALASEEEDEGGNASAEALVVSSFGFTLADIVDHFFPPFARLDVLVVDAAPATESILAALVDVPSAARPKWVLAACSEDDAQAQLETLLWLEYIPERLPRRFAAGADVPAVVFANDLEAVCLYTYAPVIDPRTPRSADVFFVVASYRHWRGSDVARGFQVAEGWPRAALIRGCRPLHPWGHASYGPYLPPACT